MRNKNKAASQKVNIDLYSLCIRFMTVKLLIITAVCMEFGIQPEYIVCNIYEILYA